MNRCILWENPFPPPGSIPFGLPSPHLSHGACWQNNIPGVNLSSWPPGGACSRRTTLLPRHPSSATNPIMHCPRFKVSPACVAQGTAGVVFSHQKHRLCQKPWNNVDDAAEMLTEDGALFQDAFETNRVLKSVFNLWRRAFRTNSIIKTQSNPKPK